VLALHADPATRPAASKAVRIRPSRAGDEARLGAFFTGLSQGSRHRRFLGVVNELPFETLARLVRLDGCAEVALLATTWRGGREIVLGEARYATVDESPDRAEFALAVADEAQGHGLGARLLRTLMRLAEMSGYAQVFGEVMPENRAMAQLARKLGFSQRRSHLDARLIRVTRPLRRSPRN
jgi:acetyltransferase